jgi:calcineurin-like phosphoesterase family protein
MVNAISDTFNKDVFQTKAVSNVVFYTSDLHLGHENVLKYCNRPFKSIEEMDACLINNWNSRVTPTDSVYIVGDFIYRSKMDPEWYLEKLNGVKYLILGNHDRYLEAENFERGKYFAGISNYMVISDSGKRIVLFHYPICEWYGMHRGNLQIYGHVHSPNSPTFKIMCQRKGAYDAGVDLNSYIPVTLEELIRNNALIKERLGNCEPS